MSKELRLPEARLAGAASLGTRGMLLDIAAACSTNFVHSCPLMRALMSTLLWLYLGLEYCNLSV